MRFLAVLLLALIVTGCASKKGDDDKITGDRISVLPPASALKADDTLAAANLTLGDAVENKDWPQSMGLPDASMGNQAFTSKPKEAWRADIGQGGEKRKRLLSRPIVGNDAVYTMDSDANVSAFKLKDGEKLWDQDLKPEDADDDIFGGGLAFDDNTIYATTGYGDVCALDATTGKVRWRVTLHDVLRSAPLAVGGRLYLMTVSGQMQALDAANGTILWTHSGITETSALLGSATPAAMGDVIIAAYNSGEVYGVRAQNGKTIWNQSLTTARNRAGAPALSDVRATPAVQDDRVYAISAGGRMSAIDIRAGAPIWDADIGGVDTPVVSGDSIFLLGDGAALVALEKSSGHPQRVIQLPRWKDAENEKGSILWAGPVLGNGILWLVNNSGELKGYDPSTGKETQSVDLPDGADIAPIIAQKTMLVLTDSGVLVAYR